MWYYEIWQNKDLLIFFCRTLVINVQNERGCLVYNFKHQKTFSENFCFVQIQVLFYKIVMTPLFNIQYLEVSQVSQLTSQDTSDILHWRKGVIIASYDREVGKRWIWRMNLLFCLLQLLFGRKSWNQKLLDTVYIL